MILILTGPDDAHADAMDTELRRRGAEWLRFDPAEFPTRATLTASIRGGRLRRSLCHGGRSYDLDRVGAVWFRRPGRPRPPAHLSGWTADLVVDESDTFVGDLWDTLDVPALPAARPVVRRAQYKLRQLQLAAEVGFELPETLVGNDPDAVLEMFTDEGGRLISKQIGLSLLQDGFLRFTEPLRRRDVVHAEGLRGCPMIVQSYVPKRLELRVTVVGDRVFAAAIHSQGANHTRHDWRRYDDPRTELVVWELPATVAARCVAMTRLLGLCYGALDLVLTPDGRYVFLEINPSGQYLWVEHATDLPITAAIADYLVTADSLPRTTVDRSVA